MATIIAAPNVIHVVFRGTKHYFGMSAGVPASITPNPYIDKVTTIEDVVDKLIYSGLYTILNTGFQDGDVTSYVLLKDKKSFN